MRRCQSALPLGGIRSQDARNILENERAKDQSDYSHTFALELAYIIEHYGEETEQEAREILDLYLKGAESLTLAVSFAQRNQGFSSLLWRILIDHCLPESAVDGAEAETPNSQQMDGNFFGALLEAAALFGGDLAYLVTQIPHGMDIEDLRPRLVAAVADYRLKLKMHEAASEAATEEMICILRELSHRSRRGARFQMSPHRQPLQEKSKHSVDPEHGSETKEDVAANQILPKTLRTVERSDRHKLSLAPQIR